MLCTRVHKNKLAFFVNVERYNREKYAFWMLVLIIVWYGKNVRRANGILNEAESLRPLKAAADFLINDRNKIANFGSTDSNL
jgi:hypothetical protein